MYCFDGSLKRGAMVPDCEPPLSRSKEPSISVPYPVPSIPLKQRRRRQRRCSRQVHLRRHLRQIRLQKTVPVIHGKTGGEVGIEENAKTGVVAGKVVEHGAGPDAVAKGISRHAGEVDAGTSVVHHAVDIETPRQRPQCDELAAHGYLAAVKFDDALCGYFDDGICCLSLHVSGRG